MSDDPLAEYKALKRKIKREIASRKQAESLLEQKSLALFESNQRLEFAVAQLEKSSAENLIKLEFQNQIDSLLIHFGRVFLSKNLDDIILDNFIQKLSENTLITQCGLHIAQYAELGLGQANYGYLDCREKHDCCQENGLSFPLLINSQKLGCLCVQLNFDYLTSPFIKRSLLLVAELLCGAISRQHTIYHNIASRKIAEKSERATRDFLAMINHELRTPLNGVLGTSELLSETFLNKKQRMLINNLTQAGELLRTIINDLLDYSKINSGMFELIPTQFEIKSLVSTLQSIFQYKAKEKGLHLTIDVQCFDAQMIEGDLERITQIFVNLIGNAIKFTHQGGINVKLKWQQEAMHFSVKDTGIGINEHSQQKLFQPFIQADRSSKRAYEGTGLGLAICQQLIQLMQGHLSLKSEENVGTEFFGIIPLKRIEKKQLATKHVFIKEEKIADNLAILVVDDILLNQVIIKEMLSKLNIIPDIAINGLEALDFAQRRAYDLIFMDCRMPEMDGFEATKILRERQFNNSIIALTAGTTRSERKKCIQCGMNDILTKPYTSNDLKAIIQKWTSTSLSSALTLA